MRAGLQLRTAYGVQMVLDESRPLKLLGSFRTRADKGNGRIRDERLKGKQVIILPVSCKLVSAGTNTMYRYPSSIQVIDDVIEWTYSHLVPTVLTAPFHGVKDNISGSDSIFEVEFVYGYY